MRFYPQCRCADVINRAMSVKGGSAKLLHVYVDVEPVSFHRGFYTVDMRFFYHVTLQAYLSSPIPVTVEGLCVFDKRTILYGSEGNARIFSSQVRIGEPDIQMMQKNNLPVAVVEAVDPIVLDARIVDRCDRRDCELCEIPDFINGCFGDGLSSCDDGRQVYITLGQFSIVRLERDTQLLIPMIDYCMPRKECSGTGGLSPAEDPCSIFRNIDFPEGEFFPPNAIRGAGACGCADAWGGSSCGSGNSAANSYGTCGSGNSAANSCGTCGSGNSAANSCGSGSGHNGNGGSRGCRCD
ncbi:MAG: hypothetical protein IKO14_05655 [Oscillibacter sp.]|nr:hypothetical protein [Oscillibacter sp.]